MSIISIDENGRETWISIQQYHDSIKKPDCDHDVLSPKCTVLVKLHNSDGSRLICILCRAEAYHPFAKDLIAIGRKDKEFLIPEDIRNDPKFGSRHGISRENYPADRMEKLSEKLEEFTETVKWLAKIP